jgi:uncharacterized protein (DUF433 family)
MYHRITVDSAKMGGAPCIRRLRIPVCAVVGLVAEGRTVAQILSDYPDLEPDHIREAPAYAAEAVQQADGSPGCELHPGGSGFRAGASLLSVFTSRNARRDGNV